MKVKRIAKARQLRSAREAALAGNCQERKKVAGIKPD